MQWPSRAEYVEAVRDYPHVSLRDPKLKDGTSRRNKDNSVKSYEGAFSIVFPIDVLSKIFALRCWVKEVGNAKNRYKEISAYLSKVRLPYFVDFEYVPEGILVKGTRYPITRMEWVEGKSLRDFIAQNLQNPTIFRTVAAEFQKMVRALHKDQIAHGDLQDGNILLKQNGTDIQLKLIDYDSLFVPTLQGQPDQIVGLPEYQHPQRIANGGQANEKVDHFSVLVIYLSFLSLSEEPELWNRFKDKTERGLLFSKEDFEDPDTSDIFHELEKLSPDVQKLATTLKGFCAKTSIDQLEPLEEILPKPDADTHSDQGFTLLEAKQYPEALIEFQKAIAIEPTHEKARSGIGLVYLHKEQYADAINIFKQLMTDNPTAKETRYQLAIAYFKSGDNNKATAAANAALRIDPSYWDAHQLLNDIKKSTMPPKPPGPPPADPPPDPAINPWQYIKNSWSSVIAVALGLAMVICFVGFLIKINEMEATLQELNVSVYAKDEAITQMEARIQELIASVHDLENEKQELIRNNQVEIQYWQDQLNGKNADIRQLREDKRAAVNENRRLRNQLDARIPPDQNLTTRIEQLQTEIQQLREDKRAAISENRRLRNQLDARIPPDQNLTKRIEQLEKEIKENQSRIRRLQGKNTDLARQNEELRNENEELRNENVPLLMPLLAPAPPKEIDEYRDHATRACVNYNNGGIEAFKRKDYDKAIAQFRQAIQADRNFAITHYNLGCTYLEMKEYSKAISSFNKAVELNQRFKEVYYNRGLANFKARRLQGARWDAERALSIDRNYRLAKGLLKAIENAQQ